MTFLLVIQVVEARSGCCSWHGGVCGCGCCDGTPLSATCAPYYPQCNSQPKVTAPKVISPKITYDYIEEKEPIEFEKQNQNNPNIYISEKKVSQQGVIGEKTITYKITYSNGIETNREQTKEEITKQPTNQITLIGTKEKPVVKGESTNTDNKSWWSKLVDWLKQLFT